MNSQTVISKLNSSDPFTQESTQETTLSLIENLD